jgi:hypothetical protein
MTKVGIIAGLVIVVLVLIGAIRYLMRVPRHQDGTDPLRFLKDGSAQGPGNDSSTRR